jgi:hypothetical protein
VLPSVADLVGVPFKFHKQTFALVKLALAFQPQLTALNGTQIGVPDPEGTVGLNISHMVNVSLAAALVKLQGSKAIPGESSVLAEVE